MSIKAISSPLKPLTIISYIYFNMMFAWLSIFSICVYLDIDNFENFQNDDNIHYFLGWRPHSPRPLVVLNLDNRINNSGDGW